ncbi:hypothetical protein [uncultured Thiodictyon sp.]|jgi:hypothetical protein|uniref:hypothetical protein n=1 Tax=uncultured Thiodictyon sp. TaxID=1846217 RepID=UPI0025FDE809|nr:hypothetical protein [uncultured Thiodictyon sp.]
MGGYVPGPIRRAFEEMPGDALGAEYLDPVNNPSAYGWMMPRAAVRVEQIDGRLVPFDAEGRELQFESRPNVLPFYPDRSTGTIEMAVPGILDLIGDKSAVGEAYTGAAAINMARRASKGQYGDDVLSNAAAMDDVPWNPPDGTPIEGILGNSSPPSVSPYDLEPGSDPRYLGAAPDRSDLTYLRYAPKKISSRMGRARTAMLDPENPIRKQLLTDIEAGRNFKGADWYNTEELRDWFINELGPEQGHQEWNDFIKLMGSSSAGSNVLTNIKNASAVRHLQAKNPTVPGTNQSYHEFLTETDKIGNFGASAKGRTKMVGEPGYGHRYNKLHEMTTGKQMRGEWQGNPEPGTPGAKGSWVENPKPKGFYNSFTGNPNNIAADLHFTRYMGMASNHPDWLVNGAEVSNGFRDKMLAANPDMAQFFRTKTIKGRNGKPDKVLPVFDGNKAAKSGMFDMQQAADEPAVWSAMPNANEYGAMEDLMGEIGKEVGLTAPQVQAALWMGAAKRTGVHQDSLGTFMELIRKRADIRAKETGTDRATVMREFIRNKGLLSNLPPGLLDTMPAEDNEEVY